MPSLHLAWKSIAFMRLGSRSLEVEEMAVEDTAFGYLDVTVWCLGICVPFCLCWLAQFRRMCIRPHTHLTTREDPYQIMDEIEPAPITESSATALEPATAPAALPASASMPMPAPMPTLPAPPPPPPPPKPLDTAAQSEALLARS